jgi:hypothetical protein
VTPLSAQPVDGSGSGASQQQQEPQEPSSLFNTLSLDTPTWRTSQQIIAARKELAALQVRRCGVFHVNDLLHQPMDGVLGLTTGSSIQSAWHFLAHAAHYFLAS